MSTLSAEDKAELEAAITEAEAVLRMTICDKERAENADKKLIEVLHKIGAENYETIQEDTQPSPFVEKLTYSMSKGSLVIFGGGSLVDRLLNPIRTLASKIFGGNC